MAYSRVNNVITSVLGFNFKAEVKFTDENGVEKPISIGVRSMPYTGKEKAIVGTSLMSTSFFTNYNEKLLNKIRDYQRQNG